MKALPRRRITRFALLLFTINMFPVSASAWGEAGHRIVAIIAQKHLTATTRNGVSDLLGEDFSLASVANYADEIRNSRPDTKRFHYVDIPISINNPNPLQFCQMTEEGDCVIAAITRFAQEVKDPNLSIARRRFALKFIIHLVGDMHQPLHCADNNDRGGNNLKVSWFGHSGKGINLHSVWDRLIIEEAGLDVAEFAEALEEGLTQQQIGAIQAGTLGQWARESYDAAKDRAYRIPQNRQLGVAYYNANFAIVDAQLLKAGLRLARVLNSLF